MNKVIIIFLLMYSLTLNAQNCLIFERQDPINYFFENGSIEKEYLNKINGDTLKQKISLLIINAERNSHIKYLSIDSNNKYSLVYLINGIEKSKAEGLLNNEPVTNKSLFLAGNFYTVCPPRQSSILFNFMQLNIDNKIFTIESTQREIKDILSNHKEFFEVHIFFVNLFEKLRSNR